MSISTVLAFLRSPGFLARLGSSASRGAGAWPDSKAGACRPPFFFPRAARARCRAVAKIGNVIAMPASFSCSTIVALDTPCSIADSISGNNARIFPCRDCRVFSVFGKSRNRCRTVSNDGACSISVMVFVYVSAVVLSICYLVVVFSFILDPLKYRNRHVQESRALLRRVPKIPESYQSVRPPTRQPKMGKAG